MDFSLTTLFVVPTTQAALPTTGSTQDLTPGQVGLFTDAYVATATPQTGPYFYVAQGRTNNYLQGSKRSDKIAGPLQAVTPRSNIIEWYKVTGCATATNQITDVSNWNVHGGDIVTLTLRAHSSYIDTLYFNGLTRSVTVTAPCLACGGDPCASVDVNALINSLIVKLSTKAPGINPDNIFLTQFFTFENIGGTILRITGKPLTKYGQPCDVAAFPQEYDRMWFRTFVYSGPATTVDFIVADKCNIVATPIITQRANYPKGTSDEIYQLEKNFYSYQAGYLKHLYRMMGYNQNFESWVATGSVYDTYYIKFMEYNRGSETWGDYIAEDSQVIIAAVTGSAMSTAIGAALAGALGTVVDESGACITTTTTSSTSSTTTTTTTTMIP
jgi:hypothetical protein